MLGCEGKRIKAGLPPGRAPRFSANRSDHIDQLGLAANLHSIRMPDETRQERPDHDSIDGAMLIFYEPGSFGPGRGFLSSEAALVPNIPLVKSELDPLFNSHSCSDLVTPRSCLLYEPIPDPLCL